MLHVGPLTALAFELVIGTPERFHCGKQIASYLGLVPLEKSSGNPTPTGTHHETRQRAAAFKRVWETRDEMQGANRRVNRNLCDCRLRL
jgi:Transposase IS116/IS110/IS902 family